MASSSLTNSQVSDLQQKGEFAIKSETVTPKLGMFTPAPALR